MSNTDDVEQRANTVRRPRSRSDFFVAGGTLAPSVPSYVKRPADDELFDLALHGQFCYVLTTRQMGKSSLMIRTARRLQDEGIQTAIVDLTEMGTSEADTWYLDLITELADELDIEEDPEEWWQERASLGYVRRFTNFLRDVVLTEIEGQVVIFIDEIDTTLRFPFSDDFFAAIRATYNSRASDPPISLKITPAPRSILGRASNWAISTWITPMCCKPGWKRSTPLKARPSFATFIIGPAAIPTSPKKYVTPLPMPKKTIGRMKRLTG